MNMRRLIGIVLAVATLAGATVASAQLAGSSTASTGNPPLPGPSGFAARIDNPWFPLIPGTTLVYQGSEGGTPIRDVLTVTHETAVIAGVRCTVLHDRLYRQGHLEERTTDWYAQDKQGNVWYFGEITAKLNKNGRVTSTDGTWRAGRDGARAGVFMNAQPKAGDSFQQEYYKGQAEDQFQVLSLGARIKVPYIASSHALLTKETTPLEPGVVDHKYYVRGIGNVKEQTVKGGTELLELVAVRHS